MNQTSTPKTGRSSFTTMTPSWPPSLPGFMQRTHSPPPPSSVYSPTHVAAHHPASPAGFNDRKLSPASRPWSNLWQRLTPRLGQQQTGTDLEQARPGRNASLYDNPAAKRLSVASTHLPMNPFSDPVHTPPPLSIPPRTHHLHIGIEPSSPVFNKGLPISFEEEEIAQPAAAAAIAAGGAQPAHNNKRKKHRHRRGHGSQSSSNSGNSNTTTASTAAGGINGKSKGTAPNRQRVKPLSSNYMTRSPLRDSAIRVKAMHLVIASLLLLLTLIVFLALSPSTPVFSAPFRGVNSLLIVVFAICALHSAVRLTLLVRAFRRRERRAARKNAKADGLISDLGSGSGASSSESLVVNSKLGNGNFKRTISAPRLLRTPYFDDPEIGLPPPGEPFRVVLAGDDEDEAVAPGTGAGAGAGAGAGTASPQRQPAQHVRQLVGDHRDNTNTNITSGCTNEVLEDTNVAYSAATTSAVRHLHEGNDTRFGAGDSRVSSSTAGLKATSTTTSPVRSSQAYMQPQTRVPPPVYGVWRGSVRADPNLLHWHRVGNETLAKSTASDQPHPNGPGEHQKHQQQTPSIAGTIPSLSSPTTPLPPPSYVTEEEMRRMLVEKKVLEPQAARIKATNEGPLLPSSRYDLI